MNHLVLNMSPISIAHSPKNPKIWLYWRLNAVNIYILILEADEGNFVKKHELLPAHNIIYWLTGIPFWAEMINKVID